MKRHQDRTISQGAGEDRLIKIEASVHTIFKALEHYNNIISRMQILIFLQNSDNYEMMEMFLKLFADENSTKQY